MTRATLQKLYVDFWLQYTAALPRNVSRDPENDCPFKVTQLSNSEFEVSMQVDFDRFRYKSSSNKKPNIAVRIKGTTKCIYDNRGNAWLSKSNVQVNYFRSEESASKKTLSLIESLHYDFEIDKDSLRNHPIFHCQSCNDYYDATFFGKVCDFSVTRKHIHQHLRIPTANMDTISVLLSVAADHFTPEEFQKLIRVYDKGGWHLQLPHTSYHSKFSPGDCYRSRAWYVG